MSNNIKYYTSKEIKYYLFYNKKSSKLYAYTSDKEEAMAFLKFRNENIVMKKKKLDFDERRFLCSKHSFSRIKQYKFTIGDKILKMNLSYQEIVEFETIITNITIKLSAIAVVNPMIFKPKITKYLECIRYTEFFLAYSMGTDVDLEYDKFTFFIRECEDTLNIEAIKEAIT